MLGTSPEMTKISFDSTSEAGLVTSFIFLGLTARAIHKQGLSNLIGTSDFMFAMNPIADIYNQQLP